MKPTEAAMQYLITVSRDNRVFFRVDEATVFTERDAREIFSSLRDAFKDKPGFRVSVSRVERKTTHLDWDPPVKK